jgi:hypothetical protein
LESGEYLSWLAVWQVTVKNTWHRSEGRNCTEQEITFLNTFCTLHDDTTAYPCNYWCLEKKLLRNLQLYLCCRLLTLRLLCCMAY